MEIAIPDSSMVRTLADSLYSDSLLMHFPGTIGGEVPGIISHAVKTPSSLLPEASASWYFFIFLLLFISYAVSRALLGRLSSSTFNAAIRYPTAVAMFNDNSQLQRQRDNVLLSFYFLSMGFFLMFLMEHYHLEAFGLHTYKLFAVNTLAIALYFFLRIALHRIVAYQFNIQNLTREYLYHGYSFNKLLGIVFIPMNFILIYTDGLLHEIAVYTAFAFIAVLFLMRIYRGLIFSLKQRILNFYLFLYLCALEIVPLLFMYKWFTIIA